MFLPGWVVLIKSAVFLHASKEPLTWYVSTLFCVYFLAWSFWLDICVPTGLDVNSYRSTKSFIMHNFKLSRRDLWTVIADLTCFLFFIYLFIFFQTKLHGICEEVGRRLQNFMALDSLNNRLASPTLSVSSEAFIDILDHLDQCIEYIRNHVSDTLLWHVLNILIIGSVYYYIAHISIALLS